MYTYSGQVKPISTLSPLYRLRKPAQGKVWQGGAFCHV
jgi:hypothetical protein